MTKTDSAYPKCNPNDLTIPDYQWSIPLGGEHPARLASNGITIHQKLAMELFAQQVNLYRFEGEGILQLASSAIKAADIFFEQYNKPKAEGEK